MSSPCPRLPRIRHALRLIGWNALLLVLGVALVVMAGETYLRLTVPFMASSDLREFVPNVGLLRPPNTELRFTNRRDFWNVSRTNSLGFLDREPPSPERAAATCHISMIGDSFVEAREVPIDDKFHVRLEELAARQLPHLNVTTSAFGRGNTGQLQQLPFYDAYARLLHPQLLVLVFVLNDFIDNSPVLRGLAHEWELENFPEVSVKRRPDGKMELLPPRASWVVRSGEEATETSWFAIWLRTVWDRAIGKLFPREHDFIRRVEALRGRSGYAALLEGWRPTKRRDMLRVFARRDLPPVFEDALEYTAFALRQFKDRADRDGAKLVIMATYRMKAKAFGTHLFERMSEIAAALGIPVIDQADYIVRQGAELEDARWRYDAHWNVTGHRWAAEALLEYLKDHQAICNGPASAASSLEVP